MWYKLAAFIFFPVLVLNAMEPDEWMFYHQEPYTTVIEWNGHKYVAQILVHDSSCKCFDDEVSEDIYGNE